LKTRRLSLHSRKKFLKPEAYCQSQGVDEAIPSTHADGRWAKRGPLLLVAGYQMMKAGTPQQKEPSKYVGADSCKVCHEDVYKKFETTPHWKTMLDTRRGHKEKTPPDPAVGFADFCVNMVTTSLRWAF
jgi:hypothetical protein